MTIYFIQAGDRGPVKIGHAKDVFRRLASIQTHNHKECILLRVRRGGVHEERHLHHRFMQYRVHSEWFSLKGDLAAYLKSLRKPDHYPPYILIKQRGGHLRAEIGDVIIRDAEGVFSVLSAQKFAEQYQRPC